MNQKNIHGNKIAGSVLILIAILLLSCVFAVSTKEYINNQLRPITECPPGEVMVLDTVNGGYMCVPSGIGGSHDIPSAESAEEALQDEAEKGIGQELESRQ